MESLDLDDDDAGENKVFVQGGIDFLEVPKYLQEPPEQSKNLEKATKTYNHLQLAEGLQERGRSLSVEEIGVEDKKTSLNQS